MKNKNIKNKPKNVVDGFFYILDFPKGTPHIKGIHKINPQSQIFSSTTTAAKG